jgi:hypothetical protein
MRYACGDDRHAVHLRCLARNMRALDGPASKCLETCALCRGVFVESSGLRRDLEIRDIIVSHYANIPGTDAAIDRVAADIRLRDLLYENSESDETKPSLLAYRQTILVERQLIQLETTRMRLVELLQAECVALGDFNSTRQCMNSVLMSRLACNERVIAIMQAKESMLGIMGMQ